MLNARTFSVLVLASAAGLSGCVSRTLNISGYEPKAFSMSGDEARYVDKAVEGEEAHGNSPKERCAYWQLKRNAGNDYERQSEFIQTAEMVWCSRARAQPEREDQHETRAPAVKKKNAAALRKEAEERRQEEQEAAAALAEKMERIKQIAAEEVRTGRCTPVVAKDFLDFVAGTSEKFSYMRGESWETVDSRVLVLTDKPKELMTIDGRGEDHVFGLSLLPMQLHVVDSDGNEVQRGSIYQEMVSSHLVSRSYRATGRPFTVSATGTGCAAVVAMRKL